MISDAKVYSHTSYVMRRAVCPAFTLNETLIVIVVVSVLMQLALPAIQSARESSRRTQCENNLQRLGAAVLLHHEKVGAYPTGGWAWWWLGDPDRGSGPDQPGSWIFCIRPYIEGEPFTMPKGQKAREKSEAIVNLCSTPISIFACPSRRDAVALPVVDPELNTNDTYRLPISQVARSDYAINTGDHGKGGLQEKEYPQIPQTLQQANDPRFKWYDTSKYTGISYCRSQIRSDDVTDGISMTYMIGEKIIKPKYYLTGTDPGDNVSMYSGFDDDNGRSASFLPRQDDEHADPSGFGSAHPDCWLAVFCDCSLHQMSYRIDGTVHKRLANRADGKSINAQFDIE